LISNTPPHKDIDPISLWILARLMNDELMDKKDLLKKLCAASFDMIKDAEYYNKILEQMEDKKWIVITTKTIDNTKLMVDPSDQTFTYDPSQHSEPIKVTDQHIISGYQIDLEGIIKFRQCAVEPCKYLLDSIAEDGILPSDNTVEIFVAELKESKNNLTSFVISRILNNAPYFIQIITETMDSLLS